ncbi:MAG: PAS domain-containing protein, partial [bacterium]
MAVPHPDANVAGQESDVLLRLSREIIEYTRDLLLVCDGNDGIITEVNRRFEDITGWKREDWVGKPFAGLIYDEDLPRAFDLYVKGLKSQPVTGDLRLRTPTGEPRTLAFQNRPHMEKNKVVGVVMMGRDITDRRRLEIQLSRQTQQLEAILEHAPAGIMLFESAPDGAPHERARLTVVNRKAIELVGWFINPAMELGQLPESLHVTRDGGAAYPIEELPVTRVFVSGRVAIAGDLHIERPDDTGVQLRMSAAPILNEKKEVTAVLALFTEASEARDLDVQRQSLQAQLQGFFTAMPVGVVLFDRTGKLTFMNHGAEALLGAEGDSKLDSHEFARFFQIVREEPSSARPAGGARADDGAHREYPAAELPHLKVLETRDRVEADDLIVEAKDAARTRRYLKATALPQFDTKQNMIGVILMLQDSTDIRRFDAWQRQYHAVVEMAQ